MLSNNPSVIRTLASQCPADSSPYTGEPTAAAGLLNGKSLYGTTRLAGGFREPTKDPECFYIRDLFGIRNQLSSSSLALIAFISMSISSFFLGSRRRSAG